MCTQKMVGITSYCGTSLIYSLFKDGLPQLESSFEEKKRKGPTTPIPDISVRLDNVDHWPEFAN